MSPVVRFDSRDFAPAAQPPLAFAVDSLTWSAIGGPLQANLSTQGTRLQLWQLVNLLRCPVTIFSDQARLAWWGCVTEVRLKLRSGEVGLALDGMYNAVRGAYTLASGASTVGVHKFTDWAVDQASIDQYGRKEYLANLGNLSSALADHRRDAILARRKWPQGTSPTPAMRASRLERYSSRAEIYSATVICRGWMSTLDWLYATIPLVPGVTYTTTGGAEQAVGSASNNTKVAQTLTVGSSTINALELWVYARKVGAPTDNLQIDVYAVDGSGHPTGSPLVSGVSLPGTGLSTTAGWLGGAMGEERGLGAKRKYAVVVSRSGAVSGTNYYAVNVNTALGFTGGAFWIWNGSSWVTRSPDADMPFKVMVNNRVESTQQIADLVDNFGQFLAGTLVEEASGFTLPSYRDGDTTALAEIQALLDAGGAGGRRLLARITPERYLAIQEEPLDSQVDYQIEGDQVYTNTRQRVDELDPPVGRWVRWTDAAPAGIDATRIDDPSLQFVEGANWSPQAGLRLTYKGQLTIENMFKAVRA